MSSESAIDNSRICVISGRYPHTKFESYINHKVYCDRHGYAYIHCNWPTGAKNPYFNKLRYLKAYTPYFDYLFWIDDDAFFLEVDTPLDFLFPKGDEFLSICRGPDFKNITTVISSGQFLLRVNDVGRKFLDAAEKIDLASVKAWWPKEFGFFSNGDQDAMIYLIETDPSFRKVMFHEYRQFNSRIENLLAGESPFLIHFTGPSKRKQRTWRQAQSLLNRPPSLLPLQVERALSVPRPRFKYVPMCIKKFGLATYSILRQFLQMR